MHRPMGLPSYSAAAVVGLDGLNAVSCVHGPDDLDPHAGGGAVKDADLLCP